MDSKRKLEALTGLRFFLAAWVVLFHQSGKIGSVPPELSGVLHTGYVAVGFFFVLSGFVLAYNYSSRQSWSNRDLTNFWISRFARIYPAYLLGLLAVIPLMLFGRQGIHSASPEALVSDGFGLFMSVALLQAWIPQAALSWNGPGWSLSVEVFFYLCFPLIVAPLWSTTRVRNFLLIGAVLWMVALVPPLLAIGSQIPDFASARADFDVTDAVWANLVKFNPLVRLPEFCAGILAARLHDLAERTRPNWIGKGSLIYLPAMAATVALLSRASEFPYPLVHNGLLLPLYVCVVLGLALGGGPLETLLATRPLVFLGGASYSLYILHVPFSSWFYGLARLVKGSDISGSAGVALYIAAVVLMSAMVFRFVEEPAGRYIRHSLSRAAFGPRQEQEAVAPLDRASIPG